LGSCICWSFLRASCAKKAPLPSQDTTPYNLEYGALPTPDIEGDNALTVQGVQLGRMLFYEKRLSGDNSMSCASCHRQEHAFSDTAQFSIGIHGDPSHRQAMSAVNMLWNKNGYFWDGRAEKLRDQSLMPIQDPIEMDERLDNVVENWSRTPRTPISFYVHSALPSPVQI
jgi:cytochrome c peroxidase